MSNINLSRNLTLIIKPTNECNMRCTYCYHYEKGYKGNRMSLDSFEEICAKSFPYANKINILWHGGEPLMMGINFYEKTFEIIEKYKKLYNNIVSVSFQSNGTLIDEKWIELFKMHKVGLGLSFDGIDNEKTRGNTELILEKFRLLQHHDFKFGVIQVITAQTIDKVIETYNYYKSINVQIKLNKVFETSLANFQKNIYMDVDKYIKNMSDLFDYWLKDVDCNINVDPFDEYVKLACGLATSCSHSSCLFRWMSIDALGDITPCGRNYSEKYNLGNIKEYDNLKDAFRTQAYLNLLDESVTRRNKCLENCDVYNFCKGGCNNDKLLDGKIEDNGGFSCLVFKGLFSYIKKRVDEIKENIQEYEDINPRVLKVIKSLKK